MDPVASALLMDLVIIPLAKELLARRNIHGVTAESLELITKDPIHTLRVIQQTPALRTKIITDLANAADNIGSDAIDAVAALFAAMTPGGPGHEHTDG